MAEALARVKRALGADAFIVNTRSYRRGPGLGRLGSPIVEITASRDRVSVNSAAGMVRVKPASGGALKADRAAHLTRDGDRTVVQEHPSRGDRARGTASSGAEYAPTPAFPTDSPLRSDELNGVHRRLIESEVAAELADELVRRLRVELSDEQRRCPRTVRAQLAGFVGSMVPVAPRPAPRHDAGPWVVALVGATGVGKTTTVAKLAANYSLRDRRRVGLITTDVVRIAAVEQLRTYSDVLGLELRVVATPGQMRDTLAQWNDRDVVLIDTPGRNPGDASRLAELGELLSAAKPHETHLVLPGTSAWPVLLRTIDGFAGLGVNRVIMTRLDEAVGFGIILNCLNRARGRLSYMTTGQTVPHDIERGESERVADLILGPPVQFKAVRTGAASATC